MTYVIEGKITKQERPEKYLNQWVDIKVLDDLRHGITKRKTFMTTSKKFANVMNNKGCNFLYNDSIDTAASLCGQMNYEVCDSKVLTPNDWGSFLDKKYGSTDQEQVVKAELRIWSETRLPLPWLYMTAFGSLDNVYVFNDGFEKEPNAIHSGSKNTFGLVLDVPFLYLGVQNTRTKTNTKRTTYRTF